MPKVLVAETDCNSRAGLSRILTDEGFAVVPAPDGKTALTLATPPIAALITDFQLHDIAALKLMAQLKPMNPDLTTIILTTSGMPELDALVGEGGILACLTKPIDVEKLLRLLKEATSRTILKQGQEV